MVHRHFSGKVSQGRGIEARGAGKHTDHRTEPKLRGFVLCALVRAYLRRWRLGLRLGLRLRLLRKKPAGRMGLGDAHHLNGPFRKLPVLSSLPSLDVILLALLILILILI